ncbi:MAG: hypothetical protein WC325_10040 [Candidatus Bathyarchaeia archaeon]|jgi:hypothetical protein
MRITTNISASQYKTFKQKAEQLNITEYELAKQAILTIISQPTEAMKIRLIIVQALKEAYQILDGAP